MPKLAPPPPVTPETWRALFAAAAAFAAIEPWEYMYDSDAVGLIDPATGETRIATVLGNAGEVFAAVIYRRPAGLRWILQTLGDAPEVGDLNAFDGMDCLKLEFVPKRELEKPDRAVIKAAAIKPEGKGAVWPQFRSSEPGWHPWHINQAEAEQLLADLPRFTAFCKLFEEHPDLFDGRAETEIPFLPVVLPDRLLVPSDLDWRPLLLPPITGLEPFQAPAEELEQLRALKHQPGLACEFDSSFLPGGSILENGRPCFGRFSLLVEKQRGLVIGMAVQSGALNPGEAAGRSLVAALLKAGQLPEKVFIGGSRLQSALQPLCDELHIELWPVSSLPALEEAVESLSQHMMTGVGPRG
jgi:Domain of unknown function (DUF6930)